MTDLIRAAEMGVVPLDVFKATVKRRLLAALAALEHVKTVPSDVVELADEPFMGALNALDEFLYAIGRDARRAEDVETERERKVAAKVRHPEIERVVTRIDERVQEAVEMLGTLEATPSVRWTLAPMYADLLVQSLVRLLDLFPRDAFSGDRVNLLHLDRDPTIAGIVTLMRARKAGMVAA